MMVGGRDFDREYGKLWLPSDVSREIKTKIERGKAVDQMVKITDQKVFPCSLSIVVIYTKYQFKRLLLKFISKDSCKSFLKISVKSA